MKYQLLSFVTFYMGCNTELEKSTEELQAENNDLQADVAALTDMVTQLQTDIELLKNEHDAQNTRVGSLSDSMDDMNTTINTLDDTVQTLQVDVDSFSTALVDYPTNTDMAIYVSDNAPTKELFADLEIRTFDIETIIGTYSTDIQALQTSLTSINGTVQTLTGNYTTLENTVSVLNASTSTIEGEILTLSTTLSTLEGDVQNNSSNLTTLQSTVEENTDTIESNILLLEVLDDAVITLESSGEQTIIESGAILIWSGTLNDIPSGWSLCDGTNGTPDLTNRFVVGAGSSYTVAATGGSTSNSISSTTRAVSQCSDQLPNFSCSNQSALMVKTVSGASTLPPYYALAYIMKL